MAFRENTKNGVTFLTAGNILAPHAFSTRLGGVSGGHLASLNLGATRGDEPENVAENWRRFGAAAGIPTEKFVHGFQTHSACVRVACARDAHGILEKAAWDSVDGYVTNVPGLPLAVFTADCAPILLHEPVAGVVAAVHGGWRGVAGDICCAAVEAMAFLGAEPSRIRAAVGPCIGPCCFETDRDVPLALDALLGGDSDGLFVPEEGRPGKLLVDLPGTIARRLGQLGLSEENIELSGECTVCRPELYWSHRATQGRRGSQANLIML